MQCPDDITPEVARFAESIVAGGTPLFIACEPIKGKPPRECFPIVTDHSKEFGGSMELGWSIYLWPKVFIEAEFHAVWIDPSGIRRDIAPRDFKLNRILFLPDPSATYGNVHQVNNRRRALRPDPLIQRFIDIANEIHAEENRGEYAMKDHFIATPRWKDLQKQKMDCEFQMLQSYGPPPGTSAVEAMALKVLGKLSS